MLKSCSFFHRCIKKICKDVMLIVKNKRLNISEKMNFLMLLDTTSTKPLSLSGGYSRTLSSRVLNCHVKTVTLIKVEMKTVFISCINKTSQVCARLTQMYHISSWSSLVMIYRPNQIYFQTWFCERLEKGNKWTSCKFLSNRTVKVVSYVNVCDMKKWL